MQTRSPSARKNGEPSWRWRRIMAFGIVLFCGYVIIATIDDTRVNDTKVSSAFWLLGIVFLLYGGYSTAQDISAILVARTGRPYADPPVDPIPAPPAPTTVIAQTANVSADMVDPSEIKS